MSNLQTTGTIKKIFPHQQVSEKFAKQEFVLEIEDGQYPQLVTFQCTQSYCNQLEHKAEGQKVTVHFNLRGREWTNKEGKVMYFNSLNAWKIEALEVAKTDTNGAFSEELPF